MVIIVCVVMIMIMAISHDGQNEQTGAFRTLTAKIIDRCVSISTTCRKGKAYENNRIGSKEEKINHILLM